MNAIMSHIAANFAILAYTATISNSKRILVKNTTFHGFTIY